MVLAVPQLACVLRPGSLSPRPGFRYPGESGLGSEQVCQTLSHGHV